MIAEFKEYVITDDYDRLDFEQLREWLSSTYWSPDITVESIKSAAQFSSFVVGTYLNDKQVGYLRVVSDKTTFAWIADVYVDKDHRRKGIASAMIQFALGHPEHQRLRRWMLATQDAQPLYKLFGFEQVPEPGNLLIYRPQRNS